MLSWGQPLLKLPFGDNLDRGFHVVMTGTAELVAGELEITGLRGLEPDPSDGSSRHTILIKTKFRDVERVNHIAGMQKHMNGTPHGDHEIRGDDILRRLRIGRIGACLLYTSPSPRD